MLPHHCEFTMEVVVLAVFCEPLVVEVVDVERVEAVAVVVVVLGGFEVVVDEPEVVVEPFLRLPLFPLRWTAVVVDVDVAAPAPPCDVRLTLLPVPAAAPEVVGPAGGVRRESEPPASMPSSELSVPSIPRAQTPTPRRPDFEASCTFAAMVLALSKKT
jgi:hypothetical protein